jgi:hypothetical protein
MNYTKGEWKHKIGDFGRVIFAETEKDGDIEIAEVDNYNNNAIPNAKLISASPDTAEALRDLVSFLIHDGLGTNNNLVPIINRGTKALKKAGLEI